MKELIATEEINRALAEGDPALGALIARIGCVRAPLETDYFASLASAIVGQQLSGRVAGVIWGRLKALSGGRVTPEGILAAAAEDLRGIGLSAGKASYVKALAGAVADGALRLDVLGTLDDEAVIEALTSIKGIGRWTAEMFLIFTLGRPDVFSCGDGGLQRAVQKLHGAEPTKENLRRVSQRWAPYRTYASLYLWRSLDKKYE